MSLGQKILLELLLFKGALFQGKYSNKRLGIFRARGGGLLDHPYAPHHPPSAPLTGERQGVKSQGSVI